MNSVHQNPEAKKKSRNCKYEDQHDLHHLITGDLALEIVSRLPIKSLIRFSLVCQESFILSRNPHLIDRQLSCALDRDDPCLLFHVRKPSGDELYFAEFSGLRDQENPDDVMVCNKLPKPSCFPGGLVKVVGSCHGMICLTSSNQLEDLFIYNPFTRQLKEQPISTETKATMIAYGFGFHPDTQEYKVIRILYYHSYKQAPTGNVVSSWRSESEVYNLSNNVVRYIGEAPYRIDESGVLTPNGRLHWKIRGGLEDRLFIVSFDLSDEKFRQVPTNAAFDDYKTWFYCQLMNLNGHLSVAVPVSPLTCFSFDIWIMREYGVKESWIKQFSIGDCSPIWSSVGTQSRMTAHFCRKLWKLKMVKVLLVLKNGEMLVEHRYRGGINIVSYDAGSGVVLRKLQFNGVPDEEVCKKLNFIGRSKWNNSINHVRINTTVHVGTLKWIHK